MRFILLVHLILASMLILPNALGARELDPRKVAVLYTGDPYPGVTPYLSMKEDAFISVTPVQGSRHHYAGITLEDIHKSLRIYMPRTYQDYVDEYHVMILSDTNLCIFTSAQHFWLKDGVLDYGMGLVMVGGLETFGAGFGYAPWTGTPAEEVLPVEVTPRSDYWVDGGAKIEVTEEGRSNEFMASLPFDPLPEYMRIGTDGNIVSQKEGSKLLARWISAKYDNPPCYVTWDIGKGRTFALCHDWTPGGGTIMSRWDYYRDYVVNLMLYLAERPLPTDYLVVHQYREVIHDLAIDKATMFSLMEFVESFGGSVREIDRELIVVDSMVADAKEAYLDQAFALAVEKAQESVEKMKGIEQLALKVKDRALFWVYVIEWLTVTGTTLICGFILWSLMVRHRLYREVPTTRFGL